MNSVVDAYQDELQDQSTVKQNQVIADYLPMVKRIAHHMIGRLPKTVQVDDLVQAGLLGLLDASNHYDNSKGASFETYAGIRIRGMMLDEVRRNDWLPRSVHRNSRLISKAIHELENQLGRYARDHEIAEKLKMNLTEYHEILRESNTGQIYGYEDVGLDNDMMSEGYTMSIIGPSEGVERESFVVALTEAINQLPEREKLILSLYYDDKMNLKEIGQVLEVSESRVCQLHSQAMCRLKTKMVDWKNE